MLLGEPAKPSCRAIGVDSQRDDQRGFAVGKRADRDDGNNAVNGPDVPIPGCQPVKRLERRAVGKLFEAPPLFFDTFESPVNYKIDVGGKLAGQLSETRNGGLAGLGRCVGIPVG